MEADSDDSSGDDISEIIMARRMANKRKDQSKRTQDTNIAKNDKLLKFNFEATESSTTGSFSTHGRSISNEFVSQVRDQVIDSDSSDEGDADAFRTLKLEDIYKDSSDSSDDEVSTILKTKTEARKRQAIKEEKELENLKTMNILELVEKNERERTQSAAISNATTQELSLLSYDNSVFQNGKPELVNYGRLPKITDQAYKQDTPERQSACIALHDELIFVGYSYGIIKVFDRKRQELIKVLKAPSNKQSINRVTCMDVHPSGSHLVAGYMNNYVIVWDLKKFKVYYCLDQTHHSEIQYVRFLSGVTPSVNIITSESAGYIKKSFFKKGLFSMDPEVFPVLPTPTADICSIAALHKRFSMPEQVKEWENVVAIASREKFLIAQLDEHPRKMYQQKKHDFSDKRDLCYLDWGSSITPNNREESKCVLAVAWGRVLQLIVLEDPYKGLSGIKFDGFYLSDAPIDSVKFLSDSIIYILVKTKEARVLYAPNFQRGNFWEEGLISIEFDQRARMSQVMSESPGEKMVRDISRNAEVDRDISILKGDIRHSVTFRRQNFTYTLVSDKNRVLYLGTQVMYMGRLHNWFDYIQSLECEQLTKLKLALDIYQGQLKGFGGVPIEQDQRMLQLQPKMKRLIEEGVASMAQVSDSSEPRGEFSAEQIAIRVAIEFCLRIDAVDFLFSTLLNQFAEYNLEKEFFSTLENFILSESLKDVILPNHILKKITTYSYDSGKSLQIFERILMRLNFSKYDEIDYLMKLCEDMTLLSGYISLIVTKYEKNNKVTCYQILSSIFQTYKKADKTKTKSDIREVTLVSEEQRRQLEASATYIGLKFLLVLRRFIRGDRYNADGMTEKQHRSYLADIFKFLKQHSRELMLFNPREFFTVVSDLFLYQSTVDRIQTQDEYIKSMPEGDDTHLQQFPRLEDYIKNFETLAEQLQGDNFVIFEFYFFVLKVAGTEMKTVRIKAPLVFSAINHVLITIKENCNKNEAEFYNSPLIRLTPIEITGEKAVEPIDKAELDLAMVQMLREYGNGLEEMQID